MADRADIKDFLTTRRARLTPEQAGLPDFGGRRRVPGLRREEVALLAGMSVEYYVRLERGNASGVSGSVLDGISRALQLDDAEHAHLHDLVSAANDGKRPSRRRTRTGYRQISENMQRTLDAMYTVPAYVQNGRLDIVATNALGRAMFSEMYVDEHRPANFARFLFLDSRSPSFYFDWEDAARQTVALLRSEAGRAPHDRALSDLVGELSTRSHAFRTRWASHDVREHRTGIKEIHHPAVGDLHLTYEAMNPTSDRGILFIVYTAEPGSASHERLQLLANLTATNPSAPQDYPSR